MKTNPILKSDYPDPDVIRVGDTYYMASTTMHFMPGAVILRSFDLVNWEIVTHVYETLDDTPGQKLDNDATIYGQGMWAPSLRYHRGTFYICFVANDTGKTYVFSSTKINGPWQKKIMEGFYHDCSLLFDDDDRVYIVYGNRDIYLIELEKDLSRAKTGGLHRLIIRDSREIMLGYEGAHWYKINGKYYVFLIHWPREQRRIEACFVANSLEGEFSGGDILNDDMGHDNRGVAQGGIVDTPEGDWYAILFQDVGAVGRIPVLIPMRWENDFPVLGRDGKIPERVETKSTRPEHVYAPVYASDDFKYVPDVQGNIRLKNVWEWNHIPDNTLWSIDGDQGLLRIKTGKVSPNLTRSRNMLTQRTMYPSCQAYLEVDGSLLRDGDYAGLCALQGRYGMIALARENGVFYVVMKGKPGEADQTMGKTCDQTPGIEYERVRLDGSRAVFKAAVQYKNGRDAAEFFYDDGGEWKKVGITQKLYFGLDHFVGCRFGLFIYSTHEAGGCARFKHFVYQTDIDNS